MDQLKILLIVIAITLTVVGANNSSPRGSDPRVQAAYSSPTVLGTLQNPAINESSGLVASRTSPGLYWTHNDSGDGPFIYSFDAKGGTRGTWRVSGARARDWEDIAAGPGPQRQRNYLYIGDIGDNNERRADIVVYRVLEPIITAADARSTKARPRQTAASEAFRLSYPDGKHDAEALMVHPTTGDVYIVTKKMFGRPGVYVARAPLNRTRVTVLTKLGEMSIPSIFGGMITGGDISPDRRRVALCDYTQGYELMLPRGAAFDTIWKQPLQRFALGSRKQGEAIAYRLDGRALLTTSEGRGSPLNQVVRR
ncbi:MAG TPA: hypothetical protein VMM84_09955 [Pyrinomonadaceae bacterium]|nr:hypothetical protein [Pyrinomonadaceae bacterium]